MSNRRRGEITLDLDRPRLFKFDFNAAVDLEELTGRSFMEIAASMEAGIPRMSDVRAFLYCGLKGDDPTLTLEETGAIIGIGDLNQLGEILQTTFGTRTNPPTGAEVEADGTGTTSSPSPLAPSA